MLFMKDIFAVHFGERIKYFRNLARLSQAQLAEKIGCEPNTLSYIESGKNNISFSKLPKLCTALNIEPYQLFIYDKDIGEADTIYEITKLLEGMTNTQLGIIYKLILSIANLKPKDVHKPI